MQRKAFVPFFSFGVLLLLQPTFCNGQAEDVWKLCPGVEHTNCDAALKARRDECGPDDVPHEDGCGCSQAFINSYINCQAEFTLCTGDTVIKPSEWEDLFASWERRCVAVISSQSITIPTPTRTVSPSEKSKAPLASCDLEGAADRAAFCTQAQLSASACFSVTVDATHTLGAFPCLCDAHLLQLMDRCAVDENLAKCHGGYTTTEAPWPTRLASTCRDLGLNPDITRTLSDTAMSQGTNTPSLTFGPLDPTGTSGTTIKTSASRLLLLLEAFGLFLISRIFV